MKTRKVADRFERAMSKRSLISRAVIFCCESQRARSSRTIFSDERAQILDCVRNEPVTDTDDDNRRALPRLSLVRRF